MSELPIWPITGSVPAIGTLGELLPRKGETEVLRLLEGFSGYLMAYGSSQEHYVFTAYLFGETLDSPASEALINQIEEKFQTFHWGADMDKSATTLGDPRTQAKATFSGGIEVSRQVRYWNEDLTKYSEGGVERNASGEKPQFGFDRAMGADENLGTIIGIDDQGRPVVIEDTAQTTIGFNAVYDPSSPHIAGLIAKFPKLKDAVAYTAVGRKRAKEYRVDTAVRKQLKDALAITKTRLFGEEFSMKGASSLVSKAIEDTMKETGNIASALIRAVEGTTDGVRYTIDLDRDAYTEGVSRFVEFFRSRRWENTQFKNFWKQAPGTGSGYRGINSKWLVTVGEERETVEVQFHTRESYSAKEEQTHELKVSIRELGNELSEEAKKLSASAARGPDDEVYVSASAKIARLQQQIKELEDAQRKVFDDMAKDHAPKGAELIEFN